MNGKEDKRRMTYRYATRGTCSSEIIFDIEKKDGVNILKDIKFTGGCNGNLKGISRLVEGMDANEAAEKLRGITCGFKKTSCPDQLAHAIDLAFKDAEDTESSDKPVEESVNTES